jgi:hypothetical protein
MKVSKENNSRMIALCVIGIILTLISSFLSVSNTYLFYYYLSYIAIQAINIILLMYMISILQFSNESISVQNPFSIFLGLEAVRVIGEVFFTKSTENLLSGIGMIELIIFIYIMIATVKIKSDKLKWPFQCLGIFLLLTSLIKMWVLFGFAGRISNSLTLYTNLINVIPFFAVLFILSRTKNILKKVEIV